MGCDKPKLESYCPWSLQEESAAYSFGQPTFDAYSSRFGAGDIHVDRTQLSPQGAHGHWETRAHASRLLNLEPAPVPGASLLGGSRAAAFCRGEGKQQGSGQRKPL